MEFEPGRANFTYLSLPIPVIPLRDGYLDIPEGTGPLMFDVGLSFNAPNSVGFLRRNPNAFVLAFEPNPYHYFSYFSSADFAENLWVLTNRTLSAYRERRKRSRNKYLRGTTFTLSTEEFLPKCLRKRFCVVPVAITEDNFAQSQLFLSQHAGSSSLDSDWSGVAGSSDFVTVLGMRMDYFIDLIPPDIEWITHLKVDTEGHDSAVLRSAGDSLSRFIFVSIEDPLDSSLLVEKGFHFYRRQKGSTTYANSKFTGPLEEFDIALRI